MRHALLPYPYTRRAVRLGSSVDSLFNDLVRQFDEPTLRGEWSDDGLTVTIDLPGIAAEGIAVSVADRVLTVAIDELGWKRSLRLRPNLDTDSVSARHLDGRLTIHVGATAAPEAREISIDTTPPAVEALDVTSESSTDDSADQPTSDG
jgi:HSP20 family molecular chaperone IbpA